MKKLLFPVLAGTLFLASCNEHKPAETVPAADTATKVAEASAAAPKPDSATAMKNWMSYADVGEMQKLMAAWAGTWEGDMVMIMDGKEIPSKGVATYKMVMGGRYMEGVHTSNVMGMPFEGRSILAYDNHRKIFQNTWMDNMGTGIMVMEGAWDNATQTLTVTGKMVLAEMGDGSMGTFKQTTKVIDADHHIVEMFSVDVNGKETKNMEIKAVRKK